MTIVELTQHPVGQGGMMSGLIKAGESQFHWVYDCGSNQLDPLNREIELVADHGDVDSLFLSHLDSDHISGVDRLLSRVKVKQIVLPYLSDLDRVVAVAHDVDAGVLSGEFLTFVENADAWFRQRGVDTITRMKPVDDEGGLLSFDGGQVLEPPGGENGGAVVGRWIKQGVPIAQNSNAPLELGATLSIGIGKEHQDWWHLVPYAHRPSDKKLRAFKKRLDAEFVGWESDSNVVFKAMRDSSRRKKLRECYEEIWADHNLVSMALYAGPINAEQWCSLCGGRRCVLCMKHFLSSKTGLSWMETGDMDLSRKKRREPFLQFYKNLLPQVGVFVLPHHGAAHNFHPYLLAGFTKSSDCLAVSGPNSYGHPSLKVHLAVVRAGKNFVHVNDQPSSRFVHTCCK